jgi:hypothetical protein
MPRLRKQEPLLRNTLRQGLVCVASHVRVGGTREEAIILIFSENGTSVGIRSNIWTTSIIHYTEIFITFWKYNAGCPWSSFPICKCKLCSKNSCSTKYWRCSLVICTHYRSKPVYPKLLWSEHNWRGRGFTDTLYRYVPGILWNFRDWNLYETRRWNWNTLSWIPNRTQ